MIWHAVHPRFWMPLTECGDESLPRAALPRRVVNSRRCMCPLRTRLAKPKAYHFAIGRRGRNGTQLVSKADQARCRRWVKRVGLTMHRSLPVFPYKQTFVDRTDWSVSCQQETYGQAKSSASIGPRSPFGD